MNAIPAPYRWLIGAGLLLSSFVCGVAYDHSGFSEYKGEVKGIAKSQKSASDASNVKNEGDAHEYEKRLAYATQSISDYYLAHPVIRLQHDGSCAVSKASSDTKGNDDATTGKYVSSYSPEETEQVATRLYELQQRLIAGGVIIE